MTPEEIDEAARKLIEEANRESAAAKEEYTRGCVKETNAAAARRLARSGILTDILARLKKEYDALADKIQRELDESLDALYAEGETGEGGSGGEDTPYEVDYSLPMRERYITVKNYYLSYDDPQAALDDFLEDEVAKDYLGTYYSFLQELLATMT